MKKLIFRKDDYSASLDMESKERFSTTQRFVLALAAIIGITIVLTVKVAGIIALAFFGAVALFVVILISVLDSREKEEARWNKLYR